MSKKQSDIEINKPIDVTKLGNNALEALLTETESKYKTFIKTTYKVVERLIPPSKANVTNDLDSDDCFSYTDRKVKFDTLEEDDAISYYKLHGHILNEVNLNHFSFCVEQCSGYFHGGKNKDHEKPYKADRIIIAYDSLHAFEAIIYEGKLDEPKIILCTDGKWQGKFNRLNENLDQTLASFEKKQEIEASKRAKAQYEKAMKEARESEEYRKAEELKRKEEEAYSEERKELLKKAERLGVYTPPENS